MSKLSRLSAIAGALMLASGFAFAGSVQYYFTANGVTEGAAQEASALFTFDSASQLRITLTDNVNPTGLIASEVDGLQFTFAGAAPASLTLLSVTPASVINCSQGVAPCPPGDGSTPFGWGSTISGSGGALGAGFNGSGFSFHPYGIVNQNYLASGISDPDFNPLLVGPVTFTFALTGLTFIPEVDSATFLFGAVPNRVVGVDPPVPAAVPEPQTLVLLGLGLLSAAFFVRRRDRAGTA